MIACFTPVSEFKDLTIKCFFYIESQGIYINQSVFDTYYEKYETSRNIHYNTIYTQYNLDTTTSRPSNTFNGINFLAIPKNNGTRKSFIPKNSKFVEIDISAYHPALAATLVNFDFGDSDIHNAFAKMYGVSYQAKRFFDYYESVGSVRRGAASVNLSINHPDIEEFLQIRRPKGDVNRQCLNLHQCVVIDDEFMTKLDNKDPKAMKLWGGLAGKRWAESKLRELGALREGKNVAEELEVQPSISSTYPGEVAKKKTKDESK